MPIAAFVALKLSLLMYFGPLLPPDSRGYEDYADIILTGRLGDAGLAEKAMPLTLFRIIGYPALLAAAKLAAGPAWPWLVAGGQFAVSLVATLAVYRLCRCCGLAPRPAAVATLAPALSLPLLLDQAILTDSLYSSLIILAWCRLATTAVGGRPLHPLAAGAIGLIIAAAFLLREATTLLFIGFLPLVGIALSADGRSSKLRKAALCLLILLPLFAVHQGYREWNRLRVGTPVVTTGAQTTLFQALALAARHDPTVWDGGDPVDRVGREILRDGDFPLVIQVNDTLFGRFGMNALEISAAAYAKYFASWQSHPFAMLHVPLAHLRENQAELWLQPVTAVRGMLVWAQGSSGDFPRWQMLRQGRGPWWSLPVLIVDGLSKAASIVVFLSFLLVTPYRIGFVPGGWRFRGMALGLWSLYLVFFGVYGMVHMETRYMAPLVPVSSVLGVLNLIWATERRSFRRLAPSVVVHSSENQ